MAAHRRPALHRSQPQTARRRGSTTRFPSPASAAIPERRKPAVATPAHRRGTRPEAGLRQNFSAASTMSRRLWLTHNRPACSGGFRSRMPILSTKFIASSGPRVRYRIVPSNSRRMRPGSTRRFPHRRAPRDERGSSVHKTAGSRTIIPPATARSVQPSAKTVDRLSRLQRIRRFARRRGRTGSSASLPGPVSRRRSWLIGWPPTGSRLDGGSILPKCCGRPAELPFSACRCRICSPHRYAAQHRDPSLRPACAKRIGEPGVAFRLP